VCFADNDAYCYRALSRTIDGIRSARRQHSDGALQIIHMLLHLRQRTVNFLTGAAETGESSAQEERNARAG
jgi:hypothetical protein